MATVEELHANAKIKEIPLSKVKVDRSYQREPSPRLVDIIADDWDPVASETVLISDRGTRPENGEVEGGYFIVNGQHRILAARKIGLTKITAKVIDLSDDPDPGIMESKFRLKTNVRLGDRSYERFKAQLRAGDEESIHIVEILARFDTEINLVPVTDSGINCIAAIETLYRIEENGALLNDTLEVIRDAHKSVGGKNVSADSLKAIAWLIEKHHEEIDRSRLIEKMQVIGTSGLESRARAMRSTMAGSMWVNYYRILVDIYNEKLSEKNRLQWITRGTGRFAGRSKTGAVTSWIGKSQE